MHTLTDDELRHAPQRLLDDAHRGVAVLVTTDGQPTLMAVPLQAGAPGEHALLDLACSLFDREQISLGMAARLAGLPYAEMADELGRRRIDVIRLRPGELDDELAGGAA
jgi:predicted HTH domain antitoxin